MRTLFLLLSTSALLAACSPMSSTPDQARVRVVHASPDAPAVDVLVDGKVVLPNVSYPTASDYLTVNAGARNLKVNVAGTSTTVINATATLAKDSDTTVLAVDKVAKIAALVLTDDNSAPPAGQFKLRLVHAAPDAPPVDVYATSGSGDISTATPVVTNLAFKGSTGYLKVNAGSYRVIVTPTGKKDVAIDTGATTINLAAGKVYTAVALNATSGFQVKLLTDK